MMECVERKVDDETLLIDRISSLPDVLLDKILSSLPTKDAVATSILSKRWRKAFTWVTRLDFDNSSISHRPHMICSGCSVPIFNMFVDNVLQTCQSQQITSFRLHIAINYNCSFEPDHLYAWLCFPLMRGVTKLDICVKNNHSNKLPSALLFTCRTLEMLKIIGSFDLERPPFSICLPNLKDLHLTRIKFLNADFVTRLVSTCPSLQHLFLKVYFRHLTTFSISSPSLRRLTIYVMNLGLASRTKLTLDVPCVEYLEYHDVFSMEYSMGNLNSLVEAEVNTIPVSFDERHADNIISFVSSLSNAQRLFLKEGCVELLDCCSLNHKLPVFRYLNHLELGCDDYYHWHKVLTYLLVHTPVLRTLIFPEGIMFSTDEELDSEISETECQSWSTCETIPPCVEFHLKRISIKFYQVTKWELWMVKYFLKYASVLEELMVACKTSVPLADRIWLDTTLQKLPRGSTTCSIKVQ